MPSPDRTVKSAREWIKVLKDVWVEQNLGEDLEIALFHYLCDLGMFEEAETGSWTLVHQSDSKESSGETLVAAILEKSKADQGFALCHFVSGSSGEISLNPSGSETSYKPAGRSIFSRSKELPKGSSDPSNLQIVKKVGRQMGSYIELEKFFMERLPGRCTTRDDARKIYNFVLSRTKNKADPQAWEQLSRRRHR